MRYKIIWVIATLWLTGCSDFLAESSQDEVRPSTVDDLMQIMVGEAYPMDNELDFYTDFLTDDVKCNGTSGEERLQSLVESNRPVFSWSKDMFEEMVDISGLDSWQSYYAKVMGCNVVLNYLDRVTGEVDAKENMRGQALVLRGWYYFQLVNLFGLPYNFGNPEENLGVPLKLKMEVTDEFFTRNSVAEVYKQVEKDLLEGIGLLETYPKDISNYKITHLVGKAILSRVYLYMEAWDKSLEYSDKVLASKSDLTSLASFSDLGPQSSLGIYNEAISDEVIWKYGRQGAFSKIYYAGINCMGPYSVSDELIGLYEVSQDEDNYLDLRSRLYYYNEAYLNMVPYPHAVAYPKFGWKGGFSMFDAAGRGIRTAEMYLNRTEVYIHKFIETGKDSYRVNALNDLNRIRENRYDIRNVAYSKVDITDANELLQFYKDERRRELNFEGHRWFDLRRMGMPRIEHKYFLDANNEQVFTLEKESPRYVLPIPKAARERNPLLVPNP